MRKRQTESREDRQIADRQIADRQIADSLFSVAEAFVDDLSHRSDPRLTSLSAAVEACLPGHERNAMEQIGRALLCGDFAARSVESSWPPGAVDWLLESANPICRPILAECLRPGDERGLGVEIPRWEMSTSGKSQATDPVERFLSEVDSDSRSNRGVFFTPPFLADYMIARSDWFLSHELGYPGGFGQRGGGPNILDPALGSGVFLTSILRHVCQTRKHEKDWSEFVSGDLLPRMFGLEIMLPSLLVAHLNLAQQLVETGFDFEQPVRLNWFLADSLADPNDTDKQSLAESVRLNRSVQVIVGNPPYSRGSVNQGQWIRQLIRGEGSFPQNPGYFTVNGQPLGERKQWLHDDYVKFFRLAQCRLHIEDSALLAFVTNHGYLDNATFRGMRSSLLDTFPRIDIVDLHGNQKKLEQTTSGKQDQSVFGISQGTAIGFFRRGGGGDDGIHYADVRGSREEKLDQLASDLSVRAVNSTAPYYFFLPHLPTVDSVYDAGISITTAMPLFSPAVVTARDHLVLDMDRTVLEQRLEAFCSESVSDDTIRETYFKRSRSPRYPSGDTRGWKLADARRKLRDLPWRERIIVSSYRPFDSRFILWLPEMIDWPRTAVMSSFLTERENLAIVARRQMVPGQPCTYFWVTNQIAIDGLIRSDNRGGESIFPLYRRTDDGWSANFAAVLIEAIEESIEAPCAAEAIFSYVYGLFNASEYRTRFAQQLILDFPRILIPANRAVFDRLAAIGQQLIDLHLRPSIGSGGTLVVGVPSVMGRGYPKRVGDTVHVSAELRFDEISAAVWEFRVGGYRVCQKWLKDRRGRLMGESQIQQFQDIVWSIGKTIELVGELDRFLDQQGAIDAAFKAQGNG